MYGFGAISTPAATLPPSNDYWIAANFLAVLGRKPDISGGQFWSNALATGTPQATMTQDLLASGEYCGFFQQSANCTVPPSDAQFLELLYNNAYGRAPDASGYSFWLNALGTGTTRVTAVGDFITSSEFATDHGAYASAWIPGQAPVATPAPHLATTPAVTPPTAAPTDNTSTYLMYGAAALLLLLVVLR